MPTILLLFGLTLPVDGPRAIAPEERKAFEAERRGAGKDPARLIKLALWAESKGLASERTALLNEALAADPGAVSARGLLGQVAHEGGWLSTEEAGRAIRADAARAARLAEYDDRRQLLKRLEESEKAKVRGLERRGMPVDAGAARADIDRLLAPEHLQLGRWCESNGLGLEARAHYTTATLLDPYFEDAWKALGYIQHDGRWMSREQIVAGRKEAALQHQADRHWGPLLSRWKSWLRSASSCDDAERKLSEVVDPRAVPSVIKLFATAREKDQLEAVRLLGRIDSPPSCRELAFLAVKSDFEAVRREATEALRGRDAREFAEPLVKLIHRPWTYRFVAVKGPGAGGMLEVDASRFHMTRTYDAPEPFKISPRFGGYVGVDPHGLPVVITARDLGKYMAHSGKSEAVLERAEERTAEMIASAQFKAESSRMQMIADIQEIRSNNAVSASLNTRITPVLRRALDAPDDLGDDEDAWNSWYYEKIGYRSTPAPKVTLQQRYYQPPAPVFSQVSCFAAGTPVRTVDGLRPIEKLDVGDLVLGQDVQSGRLSFQPILALHHNPPDRTLKVSLEDGDTIVASRFHRFWLAGRGWVMARDLEVGDVVRTLGGPSPVRRVEAGPFVPVFNLDVAGGRTFFVGDHDALVHDNTMPIGPPVPFDARAELAAFDPSKP